MDAPAHFKQDDSALLIEFAKAAVQGSLADPNCNPPSQQRLNELCDFCWAVARTMVERRPAFPSEPTQ